MREKPLTALVIDPDPSVLTRIASTLGHHGLRIAARLSPDDALEYAERSRPDLVLLGIRYWEAGWAGEILAASPESVVFPVVDTVDAPWLQEVA